VLKRIVAVSGAVVGLVLGSTLPAFAHVGIDPESAPKGAEAATLTFNVPNERDDSSTTKVQIGMPTGDTAFSFVSAQPLPGWTLSIDKTTLTTPITSESGDEITETVSSVTWSGGKIGPGEFQRFVVRVGPLPDSADSIAFTAAQTYDDGQVVRWTDPVTPGGEEPEHPTPVLDLTAASSDGSGDSATTDKTSGDSGSASAAAESSSDDGDSNGLAIAALVVGIVALVVGGAAMVRGRRPAAG
jgi:uncharacterized protein YcnI